MSRKEFFDLHGDTLAARATFDDAIPVFYRENWDDPDELSRTVDDEDWHIYMDELEDAASGVSSSVETVSAAPSSSAAGAAISSVGATTMLSDREVAPDPN